jgi:ABC-type spermidine/putrescine transport system permease subunit I
MILGKGQIFFVSNLIYSRFQETANYPSGSALAIIMLAVSLVFIYAVTRLARARWMTQ